MHMGKNLLLSWIASYIFGLSPAVGSIPPFSAGARGGPSLIEPAGPVVQVAQPKETSRWKRTLRQSFYFLGVEHGFRATQAKTRREFSGPFFRDYGASVKGVRGWGDGDSKLTNYIAHPMQGAAAGYTQIQNDPEGHAEQFGRSRSYWRSRLKAMAWAAVYSTQFEIGPISEATIGNVGKKKGTSGLVDFIVTPLGGFGMMVAEDALARFVLKPLEARTESPRKRAFYRVALNPTRSFAALLKRQLPWIPNRLGLRNAEKTPPEILPRDIHSPADGLERYEGFPPGTTSRADNAGAPLPAPGEARPSSSLKFPSPAEELFRHDPPAPWSLLLEFPRDGRARVALIRSNAFAAPRG